MNWYNKDKTKMINLEKIDAWFFLAGAETKPDKIELIVNGYNIYLYGESATALHKELT